MFTDEQKAAINSIKISVRQFLIQSPKAPPSTDGIVIAGGCFTSILHDENVNDIDIFILNSDKALFDTLTLNRGGFTLHWRNDSNPHQRPYFRNNPNILATATCEQSKIQYILTDYKTREELVNHFDFVHCKVSYVTATDTLYISPETYDCIMNKVLKKNPTGIPALQWRIEKFQKKGWQDFDYYQNNIKPGIDQIVNNAIKDMLDRLGDPDAVLAYQTK
jgi:hypothetical protein